MSQRVRDLFTVEYGHSLELNSLEKSTATDAVNFVSRTAKNNGVSARVAPIGGVVPTAAGTLSVALGGSVLETFVQTAPYYSGRDMAILTPKTEMSAREKLWWTMCIRANRYRYSYGRQANRTLAELPVPDEMPAWAASHPLGALREMERRLTATRQSLELSDLAAPSGGGGGGVSDLFVVGYGHSLELNRLRQSDADDAVRFVSRTGRNNGVSARVSPIAGLTPTPAGTLTVALGGSVLETFVQTQPFYTGYHIATLTPRVDMTLREKLWWSMAIRANRYRYSYGRQANRTLAMLALPNEAPSWVRDDDLKALDEMHSRLGGVIQALVTERASYLQ